MCRISYDIKAPSDRQIPRTCIYECLKGSCVANAGSAHQQTQALWFCAGLQDAHTAPTGANAAALVMQDPVLCRDSWQQLQASLQQKLQFG